MLGATLQLPIRLRGTAFKPRDNVTFVYEDSEDVMGLGSAVLGCVRNFQANSGPLQGVP
jgi:hypothetical protein